MKLYRSKQGILVENGKGAILTKLKDWDELIRSPDLHSLLNAHTEGDAVNNLDADSLLAPIVNQDAWAAGVPYYKSRNAKIEESEEAGGGNILRARL